MQPKDAAKLVRKITDAVHYAHLKDVVHRDLKPGNVLLDTNGEPRVTDFGLAKQVDTEASNSATRPAAMVRLARAEVFDSAEVAIAHVFNRTVTNSTVSR